MHLSSFFLLLKFFWMRKHLSLLSFIWPLLQDVFEISIWLIST